MYVVFSLTLASQQAWFWIYDYQQFYKKNSITIADTVTWSWPLSLFVAFISIIWIWLQMRQSKTAHKSSWIILATFGLLYLFAFYNYESIVIELFNGKVLLPKGIRYFEGNIPSWQRSRFVVRTLVDPTFTAGLIIGVIPVLGGTIGLGLHCLLQHQLPGFCPKCKYNLTGLDGSSCPECGWRSKDNS